MNEDQGDTSLSLALEQATDCLSGLGSEYAEETAEFKQLRQRLSAV